VSGKKKREVGGKKGRGYLMYATLRGGGKRPFGHSLENGGKKKKKLGGGVVCRGKIRLIPQQKIHK